MLKIIKKNFEAMRIIFYLNIFFILYIVPLNIVESRSICIFYNIFGVRCLGCGLTRAFFNMAHLNFGRAISYNILILIIFPVFIIFSINDIFTIFNRYIRKSNNIKYSNLSYIEKILKKLYFL